MGNTWTHLTKTEFDAEPPPAEAGFTPEQLDQLRTWVETGKRSRLEFKDDYVVALFYLPALDADADEVWMRRVGVLATRSWVLTVDDAPENRPELRFERVAERLRSSADQLPGTLLYLIIDEIAWSFTRVVEGFGAEVNEIEDLLDESDPHATIEAEWFRKRLQRFRSDVYDVRAALSPTTEAVHCIVGGEDLVGDELIPHDVERKLRDTYDRLKYALEALDVVRDEITGLRDYLQTRISNEQNEIMKTLTITTALVLLPTFIVGFYGQNFEFLPLAQGQYGFWIVCALMAAVVTAEIVYLRRRGWVGKRSKPATK